MTDLGAVVSVRCEPWGREARVVEGTTLMDAVVTLMLPLGRSCDGVALCGFCRVQVLDGGDNLSPIGDNERKVLDLQRANGDERLACCARVYGPVTITTTYW